MKILILYYSGVGNTKMVAMKMFSLLQDSYECDIASIEELSIEKISTNYDALVIGFPTIHASPAQPILTFINTVKHFPKPIPTFLFTTCGLYSANTLRIFAKQCSDKNIIPIITKSYRCAATDGMLIAPFMNVWFHHEKKLNEKTKNDVHDFIKLLSKPMVTNVPRFKLYSILNFPNKFLGEKFSPIIYTHKENCTLCGKCIKNCPIKNIQSDNEGYPIIKKSNCIHCYRCIHHCSKKALSLSSKHPSSKTMYY